MGANNTPWLTVQVPPPSARVIRPLRGLTDGPTLKTTFPSPVPDPWVMEIMSGSEVRAFQAQVPGAAVTEHEHPTQPTSGTGTWPETS